MKTIEPVSIWDNGVVKQATILNAYAVNVVLNNSATFWWGIFVQNEDETQGLNLANGNLIMTGDAYEKWSVDSIEDLEKLFDRIRKVIISNNK
jgi:hypothetical protein